jgi:hypothetical protein
MLQTAESSQLALLDDLLTQLASETEASSDLLREHLESARQSLVGAMPAEYRFNLKLAYETLHTVVDQKLRLKLERFIERQVDPSEAMPVEPQDIPD